MTRSVAIVNEQLVLGPATTRELMMATGLARCTIEKAVKRLRKESADCMKNFRRERRHSLDMVQEHSAAAVRLQAVREETANRVPQALAARSPLEQAWCGQVAA